MKQVQACLSARKDRESKFTTVEVLCGSCNPAYVWERPDNSVLPSEEDAVKHV